MPPDAHMPEPAPVVVWVPEGFSSPLYGRVVKMEQMLETLRADLEPELARVFRERMARGKKVANA